MILSNYIQDQEAREQPPHVYNATPAETPPPHHK